VAGDTFAYAELGIAQLQEQMGSGQLTAAGLTAAYLERMEALDRKGPTIGAVIEVNPEAQTIAASLDDERRQGRLRGPLHGIPVLVKDNVVTGDQMQTTAGSLALVGNRATADAHVVARLRRAGAVIIAKTNLSEWSNMRSADSTSGWSARGGLTRNPYCLDRNPSGSSSGSAAAIASNFAAAAVGTETDGSIVSPASINSLVGLKPTVGLVSRHGIIPISHTQDTAGPMTRTVADAAALLTAMAGPDERDPATRPAAPLDYTQFLDGSRLAGARLGVVRPLYANRPALAPLLKEALATLAACGAVLVDPVTIPHSEQLGPPEFEVLLYELKAGLSAWLAEFASDHSIGNIDDVIAWNRDNAATELQWFGQDLLEQAAGRGALTSTAYQKALATCRRYSREEGIDAVMAEHGLDALVTLTGGPAWPTDLINGDHESGSFARPAAVAGYPHITVPAGFVHGLPIGISFVGPAWSEPLLIALGYSFEHATHARRPPTFASTISFRRR
jgi:amidase